MKTLKGYLNFQGQSKPSIQTTQCSCCKKVYTELPDQGVQIAYDVYFQIHCDCKGSFLVKPTHQDIFEDASEHYSAIGIDPDDMSHQEVEITQELKTLADNLNTTVEEILNAIKIRNGGDL